jgi:hypothetical protein
MRSRKEYMWVYSINDEDAPQVKMQEAEHGTGDQFW